MKEPYQFLFEILETSEQSSFESENVASVTTARSKSNGMNDFAITPELLFQMKF
jgi:hypothetical protein